ncbi:DNA polymerase III subunit delta [Gordonibacter sp. An230]|uniref:DNA polymerase III subunit n=1 Tax=Gordonibacter sp. An230 TaxID=1965592 RepID=UPI000B39DF51|nr:DNA polymerase III subunit delta' [Gordonibacter sp. An230]OUO88058.1 DNA polymerase III subunit delta [Gordonibacter sp. An230]
MSDAFENILGQPKVREFLRATVAQDRVSHAYLFTGPAGSNKTLAAYAFAQAVLCPKGPGGPRGGECGACDACRRVMRRKHPDVRFFAPEGAGGYLVEQIRDIVADTALAPIQAARKVYILDRVDLLGVQAANAFLKTLEEPPADVVLVLLGRTRESVLPTIVSRCQVVPFRFIPPAEAAGIIAQNSGASPELSRVALAACDGSITRAVEFLRSNERRAFRTRVLEVLACLRTADDWDVLGFASELLTLSKAPLDVVRAEQEQELAENADFLAKSAIRQIEARNKRQLTAKTLESLRQLAAIVRSWLRDVAATCAEAPELVINTDVLADIREAAASTDEARAAAALAAVRRCDEAISYNVSPETCVDALLMEVRDLLYETTPPALARGSR